MSKNSLGKRAARLVDAVAFSTIQESFIALALAYFLSLIYLIGDTRQLTPLLLGVIVGAIIFILASTFLGDFRKGKFVAEVIVVVILLSISGYLVAGLIFIHTGYQYSDLILAVIGAMIISPVVLIQHYSQEIFSIKRIISKAAVSSISSVLMILIILVFSVIYEEGGQTMLSEKVEVVGIIALLLTLLEIGVVKRL